MSRPPRGQDVVDSALQAIASATTIEQLRQAQAVVLPLQYGMSLEQTAQAIGLSKGWACRLRNQFIAGEAVGDKGKSVRGGRHREHFTPERETELLKPFLESASIGGILVVGQIKPQLEAALGRKMALSSVYKLLHRHNWRKLTPDKRHPQSDPVVQDDWKKNFPKRSPKSAKAGPKANPSG
jgi:transposase